MNKTESSPSGLLKHAWIALLALVAVLCSLQDLRASELECQSSGVVSGPIFGHPCVRLDGVTLYDPRHLWEFSLSHVFSITAEVSEEEIETAIEVLYHEDGYFLARADVIQSETGAPLAVRVSEGRVVQLTVVGVDDRIAARISRYISARLTDAPLKQSDFERALMLAGDLSGISVTSEFRPAEADGTYELVIHAEAEFSSTTIGVDTVPGADGQLIETVGLQEFYSTLTAGDMVRGYVGSETSVGDETTPYAGVYYRAPIGDHGAYFEGYVGSAAFQPEVLPTENENWHADLNLFSVFGYPILRDVHQYLYLIGIAEHTVGDLMDDQPDTASTVRATLLHSVVGSGGNELKYGLQLSAGVADGPSADVYYGENFWSIRAGIVSMISLDHILSNAGMRFEALGQYSSVALPFTEELYFGDRFRNRGYPVGLLSADSGFSATLQFRRNIPVDGSALVAVDPFVFVDTGLAHQNDYEDSGTDTEWLLSTGIGMSLFWKGNLSVDSWLALPLIDDVAGENVGPGIYVGMTKSW